jgi:cytoplasmic iron level regulating protein YaaA (DUF328/UPF0246 family)
MAHTALIVGCGKQKIWNVKPWLGAVPAKDAYTGPLFRLCRRYAETHYAQDWYIFSAFYGLIRPERELLDYDISFNRSSSATVSQKNLGEQYAMLLDRYEVIISLASKAYNERLRVVLTSPAILQLPLDSKNLFDRMKWLKAGLSRCP